MKSYQPKRSFAEKNVLVKFVTLFTVVTEEDEAEFEIVIIHILRLSIWVHNNEKT